MNNPESILKYESTIWSAADILYASGMKMSETPAMMMPFFALIMVESRLLRMLDELRNDLGPGVLEAQNASDRMQLLEDKGQGYNKYLFDHGRTLADVCQNDKSFEADFQMYLRGFDSETQHLLGVDPGEGEKFLNIRGVISTLKSKKALFAYTRYWASIDLKTFSNSEITTLEEHIKRKWADISADTAGEQYTPDDVIALIAEIVASKVEDGDRMLRIYDCTCGGGNLLFGVEDRVQQRLQRPTETFGQDWNDALYALARIESRFRPDSHIEHGNTLTDDRFSDREFDVVVANPPYGVSWKQFASDIAHDKTGRFHDIPAVSDGQLLFLQHLVSKIAPGGMGVVVHNGSTLFSGDAGSSESNIRKWLFDRDLVEALIQLPTDEFFNTGIYTYLWVLNKAKPAARRGQVMLINASDKFTPLKKAKGSKRREIGAVHRRQVVDTLAAWTDTDFARVFPKEFFYYNKQAILVTNVDTAGKALPETQLLAPQRLEVGGEVIDVFQMADFDPREYDRLEDLYERRWKKWPSVAMDQKVVVHTSEGRYHLDPDRETLVLTDPHGRATDLGCGIIKISTSLKAATKKQARRIVIGVSLEPDRFKDAEIVAFDADPVANDAAIAAFLKKYVTKPYEYLDRVVGVEINFNKVFYRPETLRSVDEILGDLHRVEAELAVLEKALVL